MHVKYERRVFVEKLMGNYSCDLEQVFYNLVHMENS